MSELQNRVGGGLNKIQGSLQQGKQKLQTVQEISQMEQNINSLRQKRQELIVQMGNQLHKKLRMNDIDLPDFNAASESIEELDKTIYQQAKAVDALKSSSQNIYICTSCESEVTPTDKFCGSCGTPVVIEEKVSEEMKNCIECEEEVPVSAIFCPCCGYSSSVVKEISHVL